MSCRPAPTGKICAVTVTDPPPSLILFFAVLRPYIYNTMLPETSPHGRKTHYIKGSNKENKEDTGDGVDGEGGQGEGDVVVLCLAHRRGLPLTS